MQLTSFKYSLLAAVVAQEEEATSRWDLSGQDVKRRLQEDLDGDVKHGRLYQNLSDLVDAGYLEKNPLDGRTNVYEATVKGRAVLEQRVNYLAESAGLETEGEIHG